MIKILKAHSDNINNNYIGKLAQYKITESLGDDHLYPVYLAKTDHSDEIHVIKTMDLNDESFYNECQIFELPEHRNIIRATEILTGVNVDFKRSSEATDDTQGFCRSRRTNAVVMEFAEHGDLFNYLLQGPLPEGIARYFFEQVLNAVEHLHRNRFCHLDLKLDNILLDRDFNVKLTDFGFAAKLEGNEPLYKRVGTPSYRPPEMWKFEGDYKGYDGIKTDMFQLGIILFILVTGLPPFSEAHYGDLWYRPAIVGKWDVFWNFREKQAKHKNQGSAVFDNNFKTLIMQLLAPNEYLRPTIEGVRESAWYKNGKRSTNQEVIAEMKKRKELMK